MRGKPATKECFRCHHRYPVTHMSQQTVKVNTGNSGMSLSVGLSKNKNPRVHSGRQYYRNKTVWICNDCVKVQSSESSTAAFAGLVSIILIILAIFLFVKFPNGFEEPLFDKPIQEQSTTQ